MNLSGLRTLVAVVDMRGIARAASILNLSQPAVTRQLQALEKELGLTLFDREGRSVRLSAHGEVVVGNARRVLNEARELQEQARSLKNARSGVLRIGATTHVIETVLSRFLMGFRRRHPGVEISLREDGGARLPQRLERGDVQLAIMPAGYEGFSGRLLYPMRALAVLPHDHPVKRSPALELSELRDKPLLVLTEGFASRVWFEDACEQARMRPHIHLESSAPHTLIALAASGYGIAIVPSPVSLPSKGVSVKALVHKNVAVGRWAVIAWHPKRLLPPYGQRFVEEFVAHAPDLDPGTKYVAGAPPVIRPPEPRES
jgi:LysR family cyn operon transcriptional activator